MTHTKKAIATLVVFLLPVAAQTKPDGAKKPAETRQNTPASNVLPANAKKIDNGVWRATDASGKAWLYYETMFGYSKRPEAEALAAVNGQRPAPVNGVEVPAGAKQIEEGLWEFKDASGKVWVYTRSPMGISKVEKSAAAPAAEKAPPSALLVKAVKGDTIDFELTTPFGPSRWSRQSSELNADEKAALERYRAKPGESAKK
jgi:hypothetical protein